MTVKMPEPVASLRARLTGATVHPDLNAEYLPEGQYDLITTDQAEAYKDACVREALEEVKAKDAEIARLSSCLSLAESNMEEAEHNGVLPFCLEETLESIRSITK